MDDTALPPSADGLVDLLDRGADAEVVERVERAQVAPDDARKETLRSLRTAADRRPSEMGAVLTALTPFLDDRERSVRLTTAKLFVTVAKTDPDAVVAAIPELAECLSDADEFYYVRARAAEALGYVALEHPSDVASPDLLADLRVGLEFAEPEVREKLAKALEYVALGNPERLRHQVGSLADHMDDENELVRYHLCTTLVAVGCEYPAKLSAARDALADRLGDESPFVGGRAAEALGLLGRSDADTALPESEISRLEDSDESFLASRARFALAVAGDRQVAEPEEPELGTLEGVRDTTDDALEELTFPDAEGECPHCGLELPESAPPLCPRCGAPQ